MAERPDASLVVLTYNQEDYVAAAIEAALGQDFESLEIIISDDCSKDRTFEVAQAVVKASPGKNWVTVRQPAANLGLVRHFLDATALARGELVVIAAGDDVSYPHRVSRLVEHWRSTRADALFSDWDVIDAYGHLVRSGRLRSAVRDGIRLPHYFPGQSIHHVMGTSSAYAASFLRSIPNLDAELVAEDFLLTLFVGLRRGLIVELDDRLVAYRVHDRAITNVDGASLSVAEQERRTRQAAQWQLAQLLAFREHVVANQIGADLVNLAVVDQDIAFLTARSHWADLSIGVRLKAMLDSPEPGWRRWMAPRLLGDRSLGLIKALRSNLRKIRR